MPRARASAGIHLQQPSSSISCTDGRLEKVELRKLSALRASNSSGNALACVAVPRFARRRELPPPDPDPGAFSASLYSSALPLGVAKLPCSKGQEIGELRTDDSVRSAFQNSADVPFPLQRSRSIPCKPGILESSAVSIIWSTESGSTLRQIPCARASARKFPRSSGTRPAARSPDPTSAGSSARRRSADLVLEECGRRQNDVGVVGGVGKELLVHHGEQVRTPQAANHFIVVGTNRRRIGVVDEQRLDRRIGRACSAPCPVPPC